MLSITNMDSISMLLSIDRAIQLHIMIILNYYAVGMEDIPRV